MLNLSSLMSAAAGEANRGKTTEKKCTSWERRIERSDYHQTLDRSFGKKDRYRAKLRTLAQKRKRELNDTPSLNLDPLQGGIESFSQLKMLMGVDSEDVTMFVEDLIFFVYDLYTSTGKFQYAIAAGRFLAKRTGQSMCSLLRTGLQSFSDFVVRVMKEYPDADGDHLGELQSDISDPIDFATDSVAMWPRLKKSALWRKIRSVVVYITSVSLWDSDGKGKDQAIVIEKTQYACKGLAAMDMTHAILDLSVFIIDRGYQCYKTGNMTSFLHSGGAYEKWYMDAQDIITRSKFLANPAAHDINILDFIGDLDTSISRGTDIFNYANEMDKVAKKLVAQTLSQLKIIRADHRNKSFTKKIRRCPLALCVAGHSSVAKTNFVTILHKYLCLIRNLKGKMYTRNLAETHVNGIEGDVDTLYYDDLAFERPEMLQNVSAGVGEIIGVINNAPLVYNMAGLDEKGKISCQVELVIASTNSPGLHANTTHACPLALRRRFAAFIHIKPKSEYRDDINPMMMDSSKIPPSTPGAFDDLWEITIERVESGDPVTTNAVDKYRLKSDFAETHYFPNLKGFLLWYRDLILEHNRVQDQVLCGNKMLDKVTLHTCGLPRNICDCEGDLQSDEEKVEEITPFWKLIWFVFYLAYYYTCSFIFAQCVSWIILICVYGWKSFFTMISHYSFRTKIYLSHKIGEAVCNQASQVMKNLGDAVAKKLKFAPFILALYAGLCTALVLYFAYKQCSIAGELKQTKQLYNTSEKVSTYREEDYQRLKRICAKMGTVPEDLQGLVQSKTPVSPGEHESFWVKPDFVPTSFDFSPITKSFKGLSHSKVVDLIANNTICMRWQKDGLYTTSSCFGIGGQYWITTNHSVPINAERGYLIRDQPGSLSANQTMMVSESDIYRYPDRDLAIFRLRNFINFKKYDLFSTEVMKQYIGPAHIVARMKTGKIEQRSVKGEHCLFTPSEFSGLPELWHGKVDIPTINGYCGGVTFSHTSHGVVILGLHQRGLDNRVQAIPICSDFIDSFFELHEPIVEPSIPLLDTETTSNKLSSNVHYKSVANQVEGQALVHGSFNGFRMTPKSHVVETLLCSSLVDLGYPLKHGRPVMSGGDPWRLATRELVKCSSTMSDDILHACSDALVERWKTVDERWKQELMIYSEDTAVNGVAGMKFVDKLNRNTSAGFPWRCSKRFFLKYLPASEFHQNPVELSDEVMDRVNARFELYLLSTQTHPIFVGALKDEALPFRKIESKKTRMFLVSSVDFTICMRMALLSFTRVSQMNPYIFEQSPGICAQSIAWHHLYQYMTKFGLKNFICGDFQGFDKSMQAHVILWAFRTIIEFHRWGGATEEHCTIIRSIGFDIAFALADINGTLFTLFGKNPSGQALTVVINGIVNLMYMRYVFVQACPLMDIPYKSGNKYDEACSVLTLWTPNVRISTYGDDNFLSTLLPWYNHTRIASILAEHNIVYTMADKERESVPFIPLNEIDFLKRKFRFECELNAQVCPLDIDSIIKSLQIGPLTSLSEEQHAVTVMNSALQEFFFHGKDVFDEWRDRIDMLVVKLDLQPYTDIMPLPTWNSLIQQWRDNSAIYVTELEKRGTHLDHLQSDVEYVYDYIFTYPQDIMCPLVYTNSMEYQFQLIYGKIYFVLGFVACVSFALSGFVFRMLMGDWNSSKFLLCMIVYSILSFLLTITPFFGEMFFVYCVYRFREWRSYPRLGKLQGLIQSCLCGFEDCGISATEEETRVCKICKHCRYDDFDGDCPYCAMNDTCEMCGLMDETVAQRNSVRVGFYHPYFCTACARRWYNSTGDISPNLTRGLISPCVVNQINKNDNEDSVSVRGSVSLRRDSLETGYMFDQTNIESEMDFSQIGSLQADVEAVVPMQVTGSTTATTSETVTFNDAESGEIVEFEKASPTIFDGDYQMSADLGNFLQRPTLISTQTWTEAGLSLVTLDPWTLFLNTSQIKNKLNNFAWFRGNLKIKIVVNSSPFYYGALMAVYTPVPTHTGSITNLIPISQRPHIWVLPHLNSAGEMSLPFIWTANYVNITSASEVALLGRLALLEYDSLTSANGATVNGCTIQVYAWIEDPVLFGPTVKLALQSDEYATGPVSGVASAVAAISHRLEDLPIIGRFARATTIGAGAMSRIASLFGWSNVPVIEDVCPVKNVPFHDLASAHISEPTTKFLYDPKGELSVDPAIVGLASEDELMISSIVQRDSFIVKTTWNCTDSVGSLLFNSSVTPWQAEMINTFGSNYTFASTPAGHISRMFKNWRGDMIYSFKIIASKFHCGRLRISWDPIGENTSATDYTHVNYTKIVDISTETDVEFRVPYMQALPWLENISSLNQYFGTTSNASYASGFCNGRITCRVLTNLSAPIDTASIAILVSVRGAENLEFANPMALDTRMSPVPLQGDVEPMDKSNPLKERYMINFGEAVTSLRTVIRRSALHDMIPIGNFTATDITVNFHLQQTRLPMTPGYDPSGIASARGVVDTVHYFPYNYCQFTPLAWVSQLFVMQRGATRWHYNIEGSGSNPVTQFSVTRTTTTTTSGKAGGIASTLVPVANPSYSTRSAAWLYSGPLSADCGTALTNCLTQAGMSVELPMMTNKKWNYCNWQQQVLGSTDDGSASDTYDVSAIVHPFQNIPIVVLQRYVSAGTDFNLHFFLNVPVMNYNSSAGIVPAP